MHPLPQPSSYLENTEDRFLKNKTRKSKQYNYAPIIDPILSISLQPVSCLQREEIITYLFKPLVLVMVLLWT